MKVDSTIRSGPSEPLRQKRKERAKRDKDTVTRIESARLPTIHGDFQITAYRDGEGKEHVILQMGEVEESPPIVRLHSECLTGDALGSVRCDCREQLQATLAAIAREGRGLLVYLRQEGRGIGLANKVRAYALQDRGMDTVEANLQMGFPADLRCYRVAAAMLRDQGVTAVRLLTNNPRKVAGLEACHIRVVERVPHCMQPRPENLAYLQTKAEKLGHFL
jgi:GTP cyclohydrolase II